MAEIKNTIKLSGPISPYDTSDSFSTHFDEYGQGGYRSVADQAARDAITQDRRKEGMLVFCNSEGTLWQLRGGLENSNWVSFSLGEGSGSGNSPAGFNNKGLLEDNVTYSKGDIVYDANGGVWVYVNDTASSNWEAPDIDNYNNNEYWAYLSKPVKLDNIEITDQDGNSTTLSDKLGEIDSKLDELQEVPNQVNDLTTRIEAVETTNDNQQDQIDSLTNKVDAIQGKIKYVGRIDKTNEELHAADNTQEQLNERAQELGVITFDEENDPEHEHPIIQSGTTIRDDSSHDWVYNPDTGEWIDIGAGSIATATNTSLGVVKGSTEEGKAQINAAGEILLDTPIWLANEQEFNSLKETNGLQPGKFYRYPKFTDPDTGITTEGAYFKATSENTIAVIATTGGSSSGDGGECKYTYQEPSTETIGGLEKGYVAPTDGIGVAELLYKMLHKYQTPSISLSMSPSATLEVGAPLDTHVVFSYSITNFGNILSGSTLKIEDTSNNVVLTNDLVPASSGSFAYDYSDAITKNTAASHSFKITAVNSKNATFTASTNVAWKWKVYYGSSMNPNLGETDPAEFLALPSKVFADGYSVFSGKKIADPGYKYLIYPKSFGLIKDFKDASTNLGVAMADPREVQFMNAYNVSNTYYVYRTSNLLNADLTMTIK